jgi:hypothetical protein
MTTSSIASIFYENYHKMPNAVQNEDCFPVALKNF